MYIHSCGGSAGEDGEPGSEWSEGQRKPAQLPFVPQQVIQTDSKFFRLLVMSPVVRQSSANDDFLLHFTGEETRRGNARWLLNCESLVTVLLAGAVIW
ncbi:hypothetical protein E2C01_082037 [Portunus trituberculatus]|uniref:Uncharacterized protein n=1 Tax=Portunus trituberculatus TaxID=210409 RepID=A0A5B7IY60_PORTR|nr:hypothetical protein [Portunus trituberculatus]